MTTHKDSTRTVLKDILGESTSLVKYARFIEETGINTYLNSLKKIKSHYATSIISSILIETVVHHEIIKAILNAHEKIDNIKNEITLRTKQMEQQNSKASIKEAIIDHLLLEKEMIKFYDSLSKDDNIHPLVREIFNLLVKNEIEHHKLLVKLLNSI